MEWSSTNNFYRYLLDLTACSRGCLAMDGVGCLGCYCGIIWFALHMNTDSPTLGLINVISAFTVPVYMDGVVVGLL